MSASSAAAAEPTPPKAWAAPPADAWPRPAGEATLLPEWPAALADDVFVVLRYVPHQVITKEGGPGRKKAADYQAYLESILGKK